MLYDLRVIATQAEVRAPPQRSRLIGRGGVEEAHLRLRIPNAAEEDVEIKKSVGTCHHGHRQPEGDLALTSPIALERRWRKLRSARERDFAGRGTPNEHIGSGFDQEKVP